MLDVEVFENGQLVAYANRFLLEVAEPSPITEAQTLHVLIAARPPEHELNREFHLLALNHSY